MTSWREEQPNVEPNWDRTREDWNAAALCARCLLMLMDPKTPADVVTPYGTYPIDTGNGPERIRQARQASGEGHRVFMYSQGYGIFADTELNGEAACWAHVGYVAQEMKPGPLAR